MNTDTAFKPSEKEVIKSLPNKDEYILTQLMRTNYSTTSEGKSLIYKETIEKLQEGETK
jgi:predicted transcriptional regulator